MYYIDFLGLAWQNFFESFPGHQYFPLKGTYAIRHLLAQVSFDRKQCIGPAGQQTYRAYVLNIPATTTTAIFPNLKTKIVIT